MKTNDEIGNVYVTLDDGTVTPLDVRVIVREMQNDYACVKSEWLIKAVYRHYLVVSFELYRTIFIHLHDYERIVDENLRLYQAKMRAHGH